MKGNSISQPALIRSAVGAALAVLCGLLLWLAPPGEPWINASYDYLFRFGSHRLTNPVTLILMDNEAFDQLHQNRGQPWDRALHARLLNRLADDGCALVVMDSFFHELRDPATDHALADAMRRQRCLVLMAEQAQVDHPGLTGAQPALPAPLFLAAATNWGVAWLQPDLDTILRRHWPFPSPGPYASLPWTAARLAGAKLDPTPRERWLRYYGENGSWDHLSYNFAFTQPKNYFRNRVVFIGNQPKTTLPDGETDKFSTPYTRWTGEASGGVEILITAFLNLLNDDWLERPGAGLELSVLLIAGLALGGGLCRLPPWLACAVAVAGFLAVSLAGILIGQWTRFWFPWLVIAAGQVPCALFCALAWPRIFAPKTVAGQNQPPGNLPATPGYTLIQPPFGEGSYGRVWLAHARTGEWRALKIIFRANFGENADPYHREFDGVTRYQRISGLHPGLLRVHFLSEKFPAFFYYVMELGDAVNLDWEQNPASYKPRDLVNERAQLHARRLPLRECVRIGVALADALDFIHGHGLIHRDIKPSNIIFVDGQPKLADLGLIAEIRPLEEIKTYVGTAGYLPPPPERPGTTQADIYALGMVLYVLCTGKPAAHFPELTTTLVDDKQDPAAFLPLNTIILKACDPDLAARYATAAEMRNALQSMPRPTDEGW